MVNFKQVILLSIIFFFTNTSFAVNDENIYIFVSFSMPDKSLTGWLNDANRIKATLVIRGLYKSSFSETTKKVLNLLPDQKGGVLLDPTLFKRFHIEKVPAVLITSQTCILNKLCNEFDVLYGDVTLKYALDEIKSKNSTHATYIKTVLSKLED